MNLQMTIYLLIQSLTQLLILIEKDRDHYH